jgi:hypothetical protein
MEFDLVGGGEGEEGVMTYWGNIHWKKFFKWILLRNGKFYSFV